MMYSSSRENNDPDSDIERDHFCNSESPTGSDGNDYDGKCFYDIQINDEKHED